MTFGGTGAPAAFVAVKNIGNISSDDTAALSKEICTRVSKALDVPFDRIYIDFHGRRDDVGLERRNVRLSPAFACVPLSTFEDGLKLSPGCRSPAR